MVRFPANYKCSEAERARWPELEREMLPLIKIKARRIKKWYHGLDYDDAVQEGRLALLSAISKYNSEKGTMTAYIGKVLDNVYKRMMYEMTFKSRMPRAIVVREAPEEEEGNSDSANDKGNSKEPKYIYVEIPIPPLSLDSMLDYDSDNRSYGEYYYQPAGSEPSPEDSFRIKELEDRASVFRMRMMNRLKGREREIFDCRTNPPVAFLKMVQNLGGDINNPTNLHIAEYLGIDKNAVDWSLWKIKDLFVGMVKDEEFKDLFGEIVYRKGWPMVHVSEAPCHDVEFVRRILLKRKLNPKPKKDYQNRENFYQKTKDGRFARMIEGYDWGCVLVIKNDKEWRTVVIEGKLNPLTGGVTGEDGIKEMLTTWIPWYEKAAKELHRCKKS